VVLGFGRRVCVVGGWVGGGGSWVCGGGGGGWEFVRGWVGVLVVVGGKVLVRGGGGVLCGFWFGVGVGLCVRLCGGGVCGGGGRAWSVELVFWFVVVCVSVGIGVFLVVVLWVVKVLWFFFLLRFWWSMWGL